jgi:hypothetical protein
MVISNSDLTDIRFWVVLLDEVSKSPELIEKVRETCNG